MCRADAFPLAAVPSHAKFPEMAPQPSDYQPRMVASELITAIQRCALGDKEQLQSAAELAGIYKLLSSTAIQTALTYFGSR